MKTNTSNNDEHECKHKFSKLQQMDNDFFRRKYAICERCGDYKIAKILRRKNETTR